jgi:hypothetical protein
MQGTARTWFTPKQRAELWERWRAGQCVADIARAFERRNKSGVYRVLALNGGIAPGLRRRAAADTRAFFPELVEFVELWNRSEQNSLPGEVVQRLGHGEERLNDFYAHLQQKRDELREKVRLADL